MQYTTLGRTGLRVSVAGLGCGGHSRLGQGYGASEADSIAVVHAALDLGINFIDTAAAYGTEPIVGKALRGRRDKAVVCTKQHVIKPGTPQLGHDYHTAESFTAAFEESLQKLQTDHVDVMHLHGVMPDQYDHALNELVPALQRLRDAGKVRFFGLTERFIHDPQHVMLQRALDDDWVDVVMTGFSLINPSARDRVLAKTRDKNIGTLIMFAVRRALSQPEALRELLDKLRADGLLDGTTLDADDPLAFLVAEGGAAGVIDGAYRFCRHEPGADVILTGTGKVAHLQENVASITAGPLAAPCLARLQAMFGAIDSVSGE